MRPPRARTTLTPRSRPAAGGKISLCSPDHISLLVHRTFNVSVPRHHIPTDDYEFEWGVAPNDPDFAAEDDATTTAAPPEDEPAEPPELDAHKSDRWVRRDGGALLGDATGHIEFTVIGCGACSWGRVPDD